MAYHAQTPLNLAKWMSDNHEKLQPPISNYCLYSGDDFILMVVGGPNTRNDFHGKHLCEIGPHQTRELT